MSEMNKLRETLKKKNLSFNKITLKSNVRIVDTDKGKFVFKEKKNNNIDNVYKYLKSRAFDYFPNKYEDDVYDIYDYLEDTMAPREQKISDLIYLLGLLHSKTTFYKETCKDDYKYIYESVKDSIKKSYIYFDELLININKEVYMSPSSYLIARNISMVYRCLDYCKKNIESWYNMASVKNKVRYVNIHNNLSLDHFIKSDKPYFISWDRSKIDFPIYDLINLYNNHYLDFNFEEIFNIYESKYPLLPEERMLMFTLLLLPKPIPMSSSLFKQCIKVREYMDYLYKTMDLATKYGKEKEPY